MQCCDVVIMIETFRTLLRGDGQLLALLAYIKKGILKYGLMYFQSHCSLFNTDGYNVFKT